MKASWVSVAPPVAAISALFAAPASAGPPTLIFEQRAQQAGLGDAIYTTSHALNVTQFGAGGCAADFNNDGYHDFLQLGGAAPSHLYINNKDGTFTDQADAWGVSEGPFHAFGASAADFNNDGFIDIFITSYGPADEAPRNNEFKLLRNNGPDEFGNWSFTDIATEAGVHTVLAGTNRKEGTGSAWGDIDLDGDLDLFVCAYAHNLPGNRLFRNDGENEHGITVFTDITIQSFLFQYGLHGFLPAFQDLNGDLYPDLFLVGDVGTTRIFYNDGDNTFTDASSRFEGRASANGMGIDIADLNEDGRLDIYETSINWDFLDGPGNLCLIQDENGFWKNQARSNGTYAAHWSWGAIIADLDHDTDKDIIVNNGYSYGYAADPICLFLADDSTATSYTESATVCDIDYAGQGRGILRIDTENDGDLDIIIFNWNQPLLYYENKLIDNHTTPKGAHWSRILLDTSKRETLAPNGIGSMVTVITPQRSLIYPLRNSSSHCTTSPDEIHAGLGSDESITAIQVLWADGSTTTYTDPAINAVLTLSAPVHPADFNRDDLVDTDDLFAFIMALKHRSIAADHNGDLSTDYFDVAAFLTDYMRALKP